MAALGGSGGYRGGWTWTLKTANLMSNPGEQPSLSEGLALGVAGAHRQIVHGGPEFRNFNRTAALPRTNILKSERQPG